MQALEAHLLYHVYLTVQEIVAYVQECFGGEYTVSGTTDLLHRLKFVYKKPKVVRAKELVAQARREIRSCEENKRG